MTEKRLILLGRMIVWAWIAAICLVLTPVALAQSPEENIMQRGTAEGILITQVQQSPEGGVIVTYDQLVLASEAEMLTNWLILMHFGAQEAPQAGHITVRVDSGGQPLKEVVAQRDLIVAFWEGRMDLPAFYDSLVVNERRYPAEAITHKLAQLGITHAEMGLDGVVLTVSFAQPQVADAAALMAQWDEIVRYIVRKAGGLERIILQVSFPGSSPVEVSVAVSDVLAYDEGLLTMAEYLACFEVSGEPASWSSEVPASQELESVSVAPDGQGPSFGPVTFCAGFDEVNGTPVDPGWRFPQGLISIWAYWPYENAAVGEPYTYTWYRDGEAYLTNQRLFDGTSSVVKQSLGLENQKPLEPATYRLEIAFDGQVVLAAECVVVPLQLWLDQDAGQ